MVFGASRALTKLGFRRDVKLFLATLVGFLVLLILVLLLLLQNAMVENEIAVRRHRETIADHSVATVNRAVAGSQDLRATLLLLQRRFEIATMRLTTQSGQLISVGYEAPQMDRLTRQTYAGSLLLGFDNSGVAALRRKLILTALIVMGAVAGGVLLLLMYVPRITRPIEAMLDQAAQVEQHDPAVDEQQYLIETFTKTVATLRRQEDELRRLHDQQKTRADDFERVTAALTRSLTSGFMAADPSGRLVDINQAGREILRLSPEAEVLGQPIESLPAEPLGSVLQRAVARRESLTRIEIDALIPNRQRLAIGLSTVPLLNEQGQFLGMLALFTDLTPVRDLERRLRDMQALADLGEMSAGIAHEFRNSLSTILGYLKLAHRQQTDANMREKIRKAEEEASVLSSAIESLLNFSRPMAVEPQAVDLRELAEGIVSKLEPHAADVEFKILGEAEMEGDRTLLGRAVENIIRNAVDAVRQKGRGRVEIALSPNPPGLTIRDTGIGIDAEQASRLFLPFQSDKPGGFGLGLPLAKKIVLLHGGTISLSGRRGEGTIVTIVFPGRLEARLQETRQEAGEVLR